MSTAKKAVKGVSIYNQAKAYDGYTLIVPQGGYNAWLINMKGDICFHWNMRMMSFLAKMLKNGHLLYFGANEEEKHAGPVVRQYDVNGNIIFEHLMGDMANLTEINDNSEIVWSYRNPFMSHCFCRMENGNNMILQYVKIPEELKHKVKNGINLGDDVDLWTDIIIEVNQKGEIVWDWYAYEHLDFEQDQICPLEHRIEWTHANSCMLTDNGDILFSARSLNMVCRIDKKTKKCIWKWGYKELAHQHDPTLLSNGNILIFDNGEHKANFPKYSYSRVIEYNPEKNRIEWEYKDDPPFAFFSSNQGGAQKLPNGNVLITDTMVGRIFEVTDKGEKVWEYLSPFHGPHQGQASNPLIYKAYRYGKGFPGIKVKGKNLNPERYRWVNAVYGSQVLNTEANLKRSKELITNGKRPSRISWLLEGCTVNKIYKAYNGYTLFSALGAKTVKLIDMKGNVLHKWDMDHTPALYGELLANGNLLYAGCVEDGPLADLEGAGGIIQEKDWDGNVVWEYKDSYLHHGFHRLPNNNTLLIRWEKMPEELTAKVKGGQPGTERQGVMYGSVIIEVDLSNNILWEWKAFEHLDPEKDEVNPLCPRDEWSCINSLAAFDNGNLYVSFKRISTLGIINKKTGKIEWKWGMHEISQQNCATVTQEGNMLIFDNGFMAEGIHHAYSRVIEISAEKRKPIWSYRDKDNDNCWFYSCMLSSAQRLPNGNTLIVESKCGRIFEVRRDGEIVWEYVNPEYIKFNDYGNNNVITRAFRYGIDYPGVKALSCLKLGKYIQTEIDVKRDKARKEEGSSQKKSDEEKKSAVMSRLERLGY